MPRCGFADFADHKPMLHNREQQREWKRREYATNPEFRGKVKARVAKWAQENPERAKAYHQSYNVLNHDKILFQKKKSALRKLEEAKTDAA